MGGFDEDKGRWLLELESGEEKAVKNDNILNMIEPGTTLLLERGCVAHITVRNATELNSMEYDQRQELDEDLARFAQQHDLRTELNVVDGFSQFSVVLRGHPDELQGALPALEDVFGRHGMGFKCKGPGLKAYAAAKEAERTEEAATPAETIDVEGMTMESKERRPRAKAKNRYGV